MERAPECHGKIKLGDLPWEISERLAQLAGNWLAYAPEENALVIRAAGTATCPALSGIPCELISVIDSLPSEQRDSVDGMLHLTDENGRVLRFVVERGEVRIQWPRAPHADKGPFPADIAREISAGDARIQGWVRFAGSPQRESDLRAFAERFGGIYPDSDLPSECVQNIVYVRFKDVKISPADLFARLQELAEPAESLQAELEIAGSAAQGSTARHLKVRIQDGTVQAQHAAQGTV